VKGENYDLLANSHNDLSSSKNYSQLFNVLNFSNVRQIEVHTANHYLQS
jgi:hypothetical protein